MRSQKNKAFALVLCLAILMVMSLTGISFASIAGNHLKAAKNFNNSGEATLVAQAGIEYAISNITKDVKQNSYGFSWSYYQVDQDATATPEYNSGLYAEDNVAIGVPLEKIQVTAIDQKASYGKTLNNRNISSSIVDPKHIFTLKIFDANSQINLNGQTTFLATILNNLSSAIAKREPYISEVGNDGIGPLKGLGTQIVAQRPSQGYRSKKQLIGISNGTATITEKDLSYIEDCLSIYPLAKEANDNSAYKNVKFQTPNDEKSYQKQTRIPININTASWPVLVALLQGIKNTDNIVISENEAIVLANRICLHRAQNAFSNWKDFDDFLQQEKDNVFSSDVFTKAEMLKANSNPFVSLKRNNEDSTVYQLANKAELSYSTLEFCFYPLGIFEITSLGQILNENDRIISASKFKTVVRIFNVLTYNVQSDFEKNHSYNNIGERVNDLHGFSRGNNVQINGATSKASDYFGNIQPIWHSSLTGCVNLDQPADIDNGGTQARGEGGNYLFKADFNGVMDANKGNQRTAFGTKAAAVSSGGTAAPNSGSSFADLVADGVVIRATDTSTNTFYYVSRPSEDPSVEDPTLNGNMPAPLTGLAMAPLDGSDNEGSLMFWFKINENWKANEWRTVFFSNTAFEMDNPLKSEKYFMGIQHKVQMKIMAIDPIKPMLRKAQIQVRRKFFCEKNGVPINPSTEFMPYKNVDFGRSITLDPAQNTGIHAQENYHVAMRWKDGNSMEQFAGSNSDTAIVVSGNFYDNDDKVQNSFLLFSKGSDFFDDNGTIIDKVVYDDTLSDNSFAALENGLKASNRFHIGCAGTSNAPEITIDDIRITKNTSWASDPLYAPSRFQLPSDYNDPVISKFQLEFQPPHNLLEKIFVQPEIHYELQEYAATTGSSEEEPIEGEETSEVDIIEFSDDTVSEFENLWTLMTQAPVPSNFSERLSYETKLNLEVKEKKGKKGGYTKHILVTLKKTSGGGNDYMLNDQVTNLPPSEQEEYKFVPSVQSQYGNKKDALFVKLIQWYEFRNGGAFPPGVVIPPEVFDPPAEPPAPSTNFPAVPVSIKDGSGFSYTINFFASDPNPIFKSPALQSIALGYLQKIKYYEYVKLN